MSRKPERVPVNQLVAEPLAVRYEGDHHDYSGGREGRRGGDAMAREGKVRVTKRQITTPQSQPPASPLLTEPLETFSPKERSRTSTKECCELPLTGACLALFGAA
jgi:hypothetical protein